jgi:hypothetical protein
MRRSGFKKRAVKPMKQKQTGSKRINLKRKAWDIFSKFIRQRDGQRCITCGSRSQLCAGHFWHGVLDFDEMNINCQCKQCNTFKSGNLAPYSVYLIKKYGQKAFEDLEKRHWLAKRGEFRSDNDYLNLIEKYKKLPAQAKKLNNQSL